MGQQILIARTCHSNQPPTRILQHRFQNTLRDYNHNSLWGYIILCKKINNILSEIKWCENRQRKSFKDVIGIKQDI